MVEIERYEQYPIEHADWPETPGVYLFTRGTTVLYVGETNDLSERLSDHDRIDEAIELGATHIFIRHVMGGKTVLKSLEKGLIQKYRPPMNVQHNR